MQAASQAISTNLDEKDWTCLEGVGYLDFGLVSKKQNAMTGMCIEFPHNAQLRVVR